MSKVNLEINGQEIEAETGTTILEACEQAGIDVPTLCHYSSLTDVGACRICTVEVGDGDFETACTTPVQDGMTVEADTEELNEYRRTILELICAEENHYCMYCDQDGDCELQDLLKEFGVDHVRIPFSYSSYSVDAVSDHLVIDHNRCILCGRCVRVCDEVVANDTLDFGGRGRDTQVVADLNQPIGESTCISCGACLQVCPTGTILSKHSVYQGNTRECEKTPSTCTRCSIGCSIDVFTRSNNVVQLQGNEVDEESGGQLCEQGRFGPLMEDRDRVEAGAVREDGELHNLSLNDAVEQARSKLQEASSLIGLASGNLPTGTLSAFQDFIHNYNGQWDVLGGDALRSIHQSWSQLQMEQEADSLLADNLEDVLHADRIILYDSSIVETHPVLASYIRRASKDGTKLLVLEAGENQLERYTDQHVELEKSTTVFTEYLVEAFKLGVTSAKDLSTSPELGESGVESEVIGQVLEELDKAQQTVIVSGPRMKDTSSLTELIKLCSLLDSSLINLTGISNQAVVAFDFRPVEGPADVSYLFASEEDSLEQMVEIADQTEYTIVQASRHSQLTRMADLVLPAMAWYERKGQFIDINGELKEVNRIKEPNIPVDTDQELIDAIYTR